MSELCEVMMLVCFGLSWPISLYKNIKEKSTKSINVPFILLIIGGYIAGITAKIISGNVNYVLAAYFLNLFVVSLNLVVYYINRRTEKRSLRQL